MASPREFAEVIGLWPSVDELATDLDRKPNTVQQWKSRNRIPADEWHGLVRAAQRRGIKGVSADVLAQIAAARH